MPVGSPPHPAPAAGSDDASARALHWLDDHGDALYRYALARTGDPAAAEDLVQDTLLAAMRARFDGRSAERTWLTGILKHKLLDHRRKAAREQNLSDLPDLPDSDAFDPFTKRGRWNIPVPKWSSDPTAGAELSEFRDVLARCISRLPRRLATLFWLREAEDAPTHELCEALNIAPANVWTMLYRAAACADRIEYAGALAAMEELRGASTPHLALAARGGSLLRRIRRLLDVPDPGPRRGPSLLAAGAAVACVVLAVFSLNAQAKDGDAPQKENDVAVASDPDAAGAAGAIKPEDLKVLNEDYAIAPGDLISVSVMELAGPGKETARTLRVPASGVIRLTHLSDTDAKGLTEHELERLIRKKYEGVIQNPTVSVSVTEARARSFSILGQINKPGQYPLHDPDFRLLNAIAQAEGTKDGAVFARVLRKPRPVPGEEVPRGRTFDVPLKPLLEGNEDLNVVIRPGDTIVVTAPRPHLVRLVVGNGTLAFEGEATTWQQLPDLLKQIPQAQRGNTMLELAVESGDVRFAHVLTAQANASRLVKEHGLASLSLVGIHPMTSKGGDAPPADENVYISGVQRSGAYTLAAGRQITLKQLVISAGIPDGQMDDFTVTLVRPTGSDKEEVLLREVPLDSVINGKQEDVPLRPQDNIHVKSKEDAGKLKP